MGGRTSLRSRPLAEAQSNASQKHLHHKAPFLVNRRGVPQHLNLLNMNIQNLCQGYCVAKSWLWCTFGGRVEGIGDVFHPVGYWTSLQSSLWAVSPQAFHQVCDFLQSRSIQSWEWQHRSLIQYSRGKRQVNLCRFKASLAYLHRDDSGQPGLQ